MRDVLIGMAWTWGPFIALLIVGFTAGTWIERRHLSHLAARQKALGRLELTNLARSSGTDGRLVTGSTVVAYDFYRRVAIIFRKLIGGRFRMHETMMARARREAILRMAESAKASGADAVHNIRLVTSNLGASGQATGGCEVLAFGTAVRYVEPDNNKNLGLDP